MDEEKSGHLLVRRPSKRNPVRGDAPVQADPVASAELELISTQMLKQILSSSDDTDRKAVKDAVSGVAEGVLARDPANGLFEIIDDDDLQAILDQNDQLPKLSRPGDATLEPLHDYADPDHLSLVSTQALRNVLGDDDDDNGDDDKDQAANPEIDPRVFNPYESV